jgi:alkyl hydroperoxide reductase subunit AhpF
MTTLLQAKDRDELTRKFEAELKGDVHLKLFTQPGTGLFIPGRECLTCEPTEQLVREVCELSPKLRLEVANYYQERKAAAQSGIDKIPALLIGDIVAGRVRYFGLPSGYEFTVLLGAIMAASVEDSGLKQTTRQELHRLATDVHIQVFVTPT